jgi:hypothetical protein
MKKFKVRLVAYVLLSVIVVYSLSGCVKKEEQLGFKINSNKSTAPRKKATPKRIRLKETTHFTYWTYQIVEVDGIEYLTNEKGGICPLVKK